MSPPCGKGQLCTQLILQKMLLAYYQVSLQLVTFIFQSCLKLKHYTFFSALMSKKRLDRSKYLLGFIGYRGREEKRTCISFIPLIVFTTVCHGKINTGLLCFTARTKIAETQEQAEQRLNTFYFVSCDWFANTTIHCAVFR